MTPVGSRMKLEFLIPARGLFGYRNEFLTDTRGEGIMASVFDSYAPYKGDLSRRNTGSLVAFETGESVSYGLFNAQDRGALFIGPGVPVYEGMVVGVSPKQEDITVNVCKKKQMTNMRAAGSDDALRLVPPRQSESGAVPGVSGRRRAAGGHTGEPPYPQDHPQPRKAHEGLPRRQEKVNSNKQRGPLALAVCCLSLYGCTAALPGSLWPPFSASSPLSRCSC